MNGFPPPVTGPSRVGLGTSAAATTSRAVAASTETSVRAATPSRRDSTDARDMLSPTTAASRVRAVSYRQSHGQALARGRSRTAIRSQRIRPAGVAVEDDCAKGRGGPEVKTGSWRGNCLARAGPPRADVHLPVSARSSPLPEPEPPGGGGFASASSISTGHAAELLGAGPSGPKPPPTPCWRCNRYSRNAPLGD